MKTYYLFGKEVSKAILDEGLKVNFVHEFVFNGHYDCCLYEHDNQKDVSGIQLLSNYEGNFGYSVLHKSEYHLLRAAKICANVCFRQSIHDFKAAFEYLENSEQKKDFVDIFLYLMVKCMGGFHPDTRGSEYVRIEDQENTFTKQKAKIFDEIMEICFDTYVEMKASIYDSCMLFRIMKDDE